MNNLFNGTTSRKPIGNRFKHDKYEEYAEKDCEEIESNSSLGLVAQIMRFTNFSAKPKDIPKKKSRSKSKEKGGKNSKNS